VTEPLLVHVTTTDMSLALLLGPQLEAFKAAGYDVVGVSAPGPHVEALRRAGIHHVPLRHATRAMAPRSDLAAFRELRALFASLGPDIVHTHNPKPGVYGRLAARAAGVPVIVNTVHGLYALPTDSLTKRAVVYALERVAAACSHAELVQNPEDIPVLTRLGIPAERIHLLGNGIDLGRFDPKAQSPSAIAEARAALGVHEDELVCGVVGRLVWEKGYRDVFAAARLLRHLAPAVRVVVIGPSDDAKSDAIPDAEIARARDEAGVIFLGYADDVVRLYGAMDLYVLASYREGFPRSAMEAAAMGLPIVATDIRGCRQVVEDGETGFLVPPCSPQQLAAAVARLAGDPQLRHRMGTAATAKAHREFDQGTVIQRTLDQYEHLRSRQRRRVAA